MRFVTAHGAVPAARLERAAADPRQRWPSRDARSKRCGCWRSPTFLDSIDEARAGIRRAPGSFPLLDAATGGAASFKGEIGAGARQDRPVGRGGRSRQPGAAADSRPAAQAEVAAAQHARVVPARQGDREVPAGSGRHRAQRPLRAGGEGRAPRRHSRASCTATSTSGASLFLEPLSTVEINNDIVALEEQEAEEVRRILLALTDAFRARAAATCSGPIDAATELDVLQARARFSESIDGVEPALSTDGAFELQAARHPLLEERRCR